jgi:hypothetical protein
MCHLTIREEHRLTAFESRVLRRIFGPKRDEIIRGWRELYSSRDTTGSNH